MLGKIYGIGVGPGDPELLTLKAHKILEKVDVVCFPVSQLDKPSIALDIVSQAIDRQWEVLQLHLPMTSDIHILEEHWTKGAREVGEVLVQGKDAAFITLGDPSFYSTYIYLIRKLREKFPQLEVEVIPGISAPNMLAAQGQVPLVESEERLVIIPGINDLQEIREALDNYENIMFLKIGRTFPEVLEILKEKGLENNAIFGSRCGFADGYVTQDLEWIKDQPRDYLSSMLVKKGGLK